jgi:hypothetical protein
MTIRKEIKINFWSSFELFVVVLAEREIMRNSNLMAQLILQLIKTSTKKVWLNFGWEKYIWRMA